MNSKNLITVIFFSIFSLSFLSSFSQCACTIRDAGTSNSYNLGSGQKLCITQGVFTGNIHSMDVNAEICVSANATFKPASTNSWSGKFTNYGISFFPAFNLSAGAVVTNYNIITFNGGVNFNGASTWYNSDKSTMIFNGAFMMGVGSTFTNEGYLLANADFNTGQNCVFLQKNRLDVKGAFNPDGAFTNEGSVVAYGFININFGATVINNCRFISRSGFNNNSDNTQNNGLIWVTGENGKLIQNNRKLHMGPGSWLRGFDFYNNAAVTGQGQFYFKGVTQTQAPFGDDGFGMNFYDAAPTNTQRFDVENTVPHSSVTRKRIIPKDTTLYVKGASCVTYILATEDIKFTAQLVNKKVKLNWSVSYANVAAYVIERSNNGNDFAAIKTVDANIVANASQQYEEEVATAGKRFYRIRVVSAGGSVKLSDVAIIDIAKDNQLLIENLSGNPFANKIRLNVNLKNANTVNVNVVGISGESIVRKTIQGKIGANFIDVDNLQNAKSGMYIVEIKSGTLITHIKLVK